MRLWRKDDAGGLAKNHRECGFKVEDWVSRIFCRRGWQLLARNYQTRLGEVDIIGSHARQKKLAFIEVKARRSDTDFGGPEAALTPRKRRRFLACVGYFLLTHPELAEWDKSLFLAAVDLSTHPPQLKWYEWGME